MDLGHRFKAEVSGSANIMLRPAHGLAWAAQTSFLREVGFYERCIIGAGDVFFCYGLTGLTSTCWPARAPGAGAFMAIAGRTTSGPPRRGRLRVTV